MPNLSNQPLIKTADEIARMRVGGQILAQVLETVSQAAQPGVTQKELSILAGREVERLGGKAAFLGHQGFPDPLIVNVNDVVVHGIPSDEPLVEGDLVGLDFGVIYKGMVTDGAVTIGVGKLDRPAQHLLDFSHRALTAGIAEACAGNRVGDISHAVEKELRAGRLSVIEELVGHGVGRELWEDPQIPNYGRPHTGPKLVPGMTIAIEPMATLGRKDITIDAIDGWTIRTADGSLASQVEHTVLITDGEPEILTQLK